MMSHRAHLRTPSLCTLTRTPSLLLPTSCFYLPFLCSCAQHTNRLCVLLPAGFGAPAPISTLSRSALEGLGMQAIVLMGVAECLEGEAARWAQGKLPRLKSEAEAMWRAARHVSEGRALEVALAEAEGRPLVTAKTNLEVWRACLGHHGECLVRQAQDLAVVHADNPDGFGANRDRWVRGAGCGPCRRQNHHLAIVCHSFHPLFLPSLPPSFTPSATHTLPPGPPHSSASHTHITLTHPSHTSLIYITHPHHSPTSLIHITHYSSQVPEVPLTHSG